MSTPDISVVGGGIIGLMSALKLQELGQKVTLLDAGELGMGASYGNAGHLATEQVFPVADAKIIKKIPKMLIDPLGPLRLDWRYLPQIMPWLVRLAMSMRPSAQKKTHEALLSMNQISLDSWQKVTKHYALEQWVHSDGSLLVAEKPQTLAELYRHQAQLNQLGIIAQSLTQDELREREPALAANQLGGVFFPNTGHMTNISAVVSALSTRFVDAGGLVMTNCRVHDIEQTGGNTFLLRTEQGNQSASKVLISMGAFSKNIVKKLTGVNVPLETERGYHFMLPEEAQRLSLPVSSADRHFIMTPMQSGLRLAGTVEYAGLSLPPNMQRARQLVKLAQPMLTKALNSNNGSQWMGFRPTTIDSLPIIDRRNNLLLAFGHQHLGLTQAAATAELISALYFDQPAPIPLQPFQLHRFQ